MKNFYDVLGLPQDASIDHIKSAFRKLALMHHPDRGGDPSCMVTINEAYETLSDPHKKSLYDVDLKTYYSLDVDLEKPAQIDGHLKAGNTLPYSHRYRIKHNNLVGSYLVEGVKFVSAKYHLKPFESNCYQGENNCFYHNIFDFIASKRGKSLQHPSTPITLVTATGIFIDFLSGKYFKQGLIALQHYLAHEIEKVQSENEKPIYESMLAIIRLTDTDSKSHNGLLAHLQKITNTVKSLSEANIAKITPLFYNRYYRNLYSYAQHCYRMDTTFIPENAFDGYKVTKELLEDLKIRFINNDRSEGLSEAMLQAKLLSLLEKELQKTYQDADHYRKKAWILLDWLPVFIGNTTGFVMANLFLQIGLTFQRSAMLEGHGELKKADEKLALEMYMTAYSLANKLPPNVELYVCNIILKSISSFQCEESSLEEIIQALQKRAGLLADVFPFDEGIQANATLLKNSTTLLPVLRVLLNTMMQSYEYNKTHSDGLDIEHSSSTLLYQVYEACLKNWYQKKFDPDFERKVRLELMEELLLDEGWGALDVEENIDSSFIMVARDEDGFLKPTRSLPYPDSNSTTTYSALNGAEINEKTGEITFFLKEWKPGCSKHTRLFTLADLQEMLYKRLSGAIFSLDPVDPDKPYHPFNAMRLAPENLEGSALLDTMLLTDYMLKFLTTNQEVQGIYPFADRSIDTMISHLPGYLRKIITDFHKSQHSGALHRFWIEAETLDVELTESTDSNPITRIGVDEVRMVVKKHRMKRDVHGNLQDVGNEDEGWPIYVLPLEQIRILHKGNIQLPKSAMIFIKGEEKLLYWDNGKIIKEHIPVHFKEQLIRLYNTPRDKDGKVIQNSNNTALLVRVTRTMAAQSGIDHRFSPEFIFAHDFTLHYNEFAQYLPEFGRLRELSRITVLVRFLENIWESSKNAIQAIDAVVENKNITDLADNLTYQHYKKASDDVIGQITTIFDNLRKDLSTAVLNRKWRDHLCDIKSQIEPLTFSIYSQEVNDACDRAVEQVVRDNQYRFSAQMVRSQVVEPKRAEIARQMSEDKQKAYKSQLQSLFGSKLPDLSKALLNHYIDAFLGGNLEPLLNEFCALEKKQAEEALKNQFPHASTTDIQRSLEITGAEAAKRVGRAESFFKLNEIRKYKVSLQEGFSQLCFGEARVDVDAQERCHWVPASVRHEMRETEGAGSSRYSFFVYGGVNIQPRANIISGGGPLGGNAVSGGSFNRAEITRGFQDHHIVSPTNNATKNHELLTLAGINPNSRVNRIFLPTNPAQHDTRSIHCGRHTNSYSVQVAGRMDRIVEQGRSAGWTQSQYRSATRDMMSDLRQELRNGNIGLNKNMREHSTKW